MTLLNIFALEDVNEDVVVISLPEGEHVIGRGVTLNCNDKRISRKHALINVGKEMVTIKSVHVNPCFFKAADGNSITILPKNTAVELNDGDQFALLADLFWFKVRVIVGENVAKLDDFKEPENILCNKTSIVNGNTNTVMSPSESKIIISPGNNPSFKGKRSLEDNLKGTCKRQRIADANENEPSTSNSPDKNTSQSEDMSDRPSSPSGLNLLLNTSRNLEQNIDSNQLINNLNYILEEDYGIANSEEEKEMVTGSVTGNLKINMSHLNGTQNNEENSVTKKSEFLEKEEQDKCKEKQLEVISDDSIIDGSVAQVEETNKNEKIKKEKTENSETRDKSETEQKENHIGETSNSDALQIDKNVILESIKNENGDTKTNSDQNEPSCSKDNPKDQQSKKKSRRERCWYAHMCYRKNPLHRVNFSHPGDDDFLSDPDDDRPVCPFGDACYRTNLTHRRDYKHTSRPAPKPNGGNTGNDNDGTGARAKKTANMKKLYTDNDSAEDDYDYNDPFIDDASSDEFHLSSDEDDDSTDWEDSQKVDEESQETRRMLKEAKRFTKSKKKK